MHFGTPKHVESPQDKSIPCKTPEYCGAISCDNKEDEYYIRDRRLLTKKKCFYMAKNRNLKVHKKTRVTEGFQAKS